VPTASYRVGPYSIDGAAYRLLKGPDPIDLSPKALDLLFLFAERPGTLVTKDDMLRALWPGVAVTDNAITQVVSELRQALGDEPASPRYVETVPRRGYRFIGVVESMAVSTPPAPAATPGAAVAAAGTRSIAVLDFSNVTGDADVAWLTAGIAETVTNDLRAIRALRVIDRTLLPRGHAAAGAETARASGLDLAVVGSFQRAGDQLRITARVIEVATLGTLAQAKADGLLADVFHLQDRIVIELSSALQIGVTAAARERISARETASLDAYRALTEGRLKLETLDAAQVPAAMADFERALALDPEYALAHVGLAHAHFWRFQASRARNTPDRDALVAAIAHARAASDLDPNLAEAHAALALLLSSADQTAEAVAAGRRAVALEPGNWRHGFRLGAAAWGEERLVCLDSVIVQYPQLAYAYFHSAMVRVARGDLPRAREILRAGAALSDRPSAGAGRFPATGLHWLLGLVELASGDAATATAEFDRELAQAGRSLFADEFAMDAYDGHAFACLQTGDAAGAVAMFERALERFPQHARSLIGLADAARRADHPARANDLLARAEQAIEELKRGGRSTESAMARAYAHVVSGRAADALDVLTRLLDQAPPGSAGWTLPVEPWFAPLRQTPDGRAILAKLAARAR
jgi:DNA-binding winged helix-turn-helix (wHTH) protein/tetratricopeptide (TPR) repeat protein